jgi:hypothetical protein
MLFNSSRVFLGAMLLGVVCGGALTLTTALSRNGWLMLLPYILLALITTLYLRRRRIESFAERFTLPFGAYVVATLVIEAYIQTAQRQLVRPLTLRNSVGPLGVMLLIGVVGSAVIAFLVGLRSGGKPAS